MMRLVFAALSGGLFGAGLLVSGMTQPEKVRGWLDVFGQWDPTLGFVLAGAIIPMAIAWRIAARRDRAMTGQPFPPPPSHRTDARLIAGSALFGLGWGLSGLCPGPSMAVLGFAGPPFWVFFAAMVAGMALFAMWNRRV
ncbi:hypothetical protein FNJ84_05235 [Paracoccus sp. M683]|uniref:DUF6691 family protein n=1 Tax=Paracoccus sp. M683 TaxID=2594268 RepID=UPI00117C99B7|nr:DUF6691 family protein [Paracoccus sp. M683]TRW98191.1 hypothetical protein FNJ84_05235 [Paracoccus sp. M683]